MPTSSGCIWRREKPAFPYPSGAGIFTPLPWAGSFLFSPYNIVFFIIYYTICYILLTEKFCRAIIPFDSILNGATAVYFSISDPILRAAEAAEVRCAEVFAQREKISEQTQQKVLRAFIDNRVSAAHLCGTTGYGYGDIGRDTLDKIMAFALDAEDACVRHTFVSGTHALAVALFACLRPGDILVSVTGRPYDTMEETIGLRGNHPGSLAAYGVLYREVALTAEGRVDHAAIPEAVKGARVCYIQRSRGYSLRPSVFVEEIGRIVAEAKAANPDIIVMVDNCYGEFVETTEPCGVGADLCAGSLIKNAGGGIAPTGGYVAGRADLVELAADRLTCPGMGKEVGCSMDHLRELYMGLFAAPATVCDAVKTAIFAAGLFAELGYDVLPAYDAPRTDIIQSLLLGSAERLSAFCRGLQAGSPVDSYATPEPWDMPGYDSPVIMAAGCFTNGASIELSADAPIRPPYALWLQGGIHYGSAKIGILLAAEETEKLPH
ncbi:MAG: hypothetical protein E7486_03655 [Ruminococcaceae bacterium]|nr:hypothetical protein [Oscillospiraceae bacterium]